MPDPDDFPEVRRRAAPAVVSPTTDRAALRDRIAETEEERADREETERDHARGDHTHCGITCEAEMPTEHLRNFVIAKGYPGTKGALDELLRRSRADALRAERDRRAVSPAEQAPTAQPERAQESTTRALRQRLADTIDHLRDTGAVHGLDDAERDHLANTLLLVAARHCEQLTAGRETWKAKALELEQDRDQLREQVRLGQAGAAEREAILEECRDVLEAAGHNGAHGDDWPQLAPAVRALVTDRDQRVAEVAEQRQRSASAVELLKQVPHEVLPGVPGHEHVSVRRAIAALDGTGETP